MSRLHLRHRWDNSLGRIIVGGLHLTQKMQGCGIVCGLSLWFGQQHFAKPWIDMQWIFWRLGFKDRGPQLMVLSLQNNKVKIHRYAVDTTLGELTKTKEIVTIGARDDNNLWSAGSINIEQLFVYPIPLTFLIPSLVLLLFGGC